MNTAFQVNKLVLFCLIIIISRMSIEKHSLILCMRVCSLPYVYPHVLGFKFLRKYYFGQVNKCIVNIICAVPLRYFTFYFGLSHIIF